MAKFLARRAFTTCIVVILVSIISFSIIFVLPGDLAAAILGEEGGADSQRYEELRASLGLDQPLHIQYLNWLTDALRGDFGISLRTQEDIGSAILSRAVPTIQLAIFAMALSILVSVPVGVISAVRQRTMVDTGGTLFAILGVATPGFWLGIMLMLVFSVWLRWLPPSGFVPFWEDPVEALRLMIMPGIALASGLTGVLIRQVRASVIEVLEEEYIVAARSKGLTERVVLYKHAFRNAIFPVVTLIGLQVGQTFGGAATVEVVFSIPGLGRLAVDSIFFRDYTMIQAVMMFLALTVLLTSLLADIVYARLDPRVRYG